MSSNLIGRYTASPTERSRQATNGGSEWIVWHTGSYPPSPVFVGSMEDAGLTADSLNTKGSVPWPTAK